MFTMFGMMCALERSLPNNSACRRLEQAVGALRNRPGCIQPQLGRSALVKQDGALCKF